MRFRTKVFIGSLVASAVSLLVIALLLSLQIRERQRAALAPRHAVERGGVGELYQVAPAEARHDLALQQP